jgi:hypothetical protein
VERRRSKLNKDELGHDPEAVCRMRSRLCVVDVTSNSARVVLFSNFRLIIQLIIVLFYLIYFITCLLSLSLLHTNIPY